MFLQYYGLRDQPFGVTPDPRFLYFSATHREALASLFYGIESGCGFLTLIAQPGMGKTTLLFHLLEKLRGSAQTVFLFQTQCGSREFFRYLLTDLGAESSEQNLARMHEALNAVLLRNARVGRRVVLVIDEAQNLADSVLETVRLLSDFETPQSKLLQIVLAGQPQLADKLAHPALTQLRQRISIVCRLHPLTRVETMVYLEYRLSKAGYSGPSLFSYEAVELIVTHSGGIPRNINNICFNALTLCYAKRQKQVDASTVLEVMADLDIEGLGHHPLAPGLRAPDSLSSFDGLSPTDEASYREFHNAVRIAWGNGIEAKTQEELADGDPAPFKQRDGNRPLESIPETPIGSQEFPESLVDLDDESGEDTEASFGTMTTSPVATRVLMSEKIREALKQKAPKQTEESVSPAARPEAKTSQCENRQVLAADSIEPNGHAALSPAANGKHGLETQEAKHYLTSVTEPTTNSIRDWARSMFRFFNLPQKKTANAGNQRQSARGRTMVVVGFILIVSGALLVGSVNQAVQYRRGSVEPGPALNTEKLVKPSTTIDPIKTSQGTRKEESKSPQMAPDDGDGSTVVTLESGQTLSEVSLHYLGRFNDAITHRIQTLNPEIKDPDLIFAGSQVRLPASPDVSDSNASSSGQDSSMVEPSR